MPCIYKLSKNCQTYPQSMVQDNLRTLSIAKYKNKPWYGLPMSTQGMECVGLTVRSVGTISSVYTYAMEQTHKHITL